MPAQTGPSPFADAVIEVWEAYVHGPQWGGGAHAHIRRVEVFGRRTTGEWPTANDALEEITADDLRARPERLRTRLADAFPGAAIMDVTGPPATLPYASFA